MSAIPMTGERAGKLLVLTRAPNIRKAAAWNCQCDCGATIVMTGGQLRAAQKAGTRSSCGACRYLGMRKHRCDGCGQHRGVSVFRRQDVRKRLCMYCDGTIASRRVRREREVGR